MFPVLALWSRASRRADDSLGRRPRRWGQTASQALNSRLVKDPSTSRDAITFTAKIGRIWLLYTVDVPKRVSQALGNSGKIPVVFTMGRSAARKTTLMPRAGGGHRLHLHGEVRRE